MSVLVIWPRCCHFGIRCCLATSAPDWLCLSHPQMWFAYSLSACCAPQFAVSHVGFCFCQSLSPLLVVSDAGAGFWVHPWQKDQRSLEFSAGGHWCCRGLSLNSSWLQCWSDQVFQSSATAPIVDSVGPSWTSWSSQSSLAKCTGWTWKAVQDWVQCGTNTSLTGFPEGDPLSCLAMLGFNLVFDLYVCHFAPDCIPLCG